ncbi:TPA: hypothetical protein PXJ40_004267 [Yersinia enterocolitica]|nr:hypothetical protein [Yersinia enterocolitica]
MDIPISQILNSMRQNGLHAAAGMMKPTGNMAYYLAARIEKRIKQELPVRFLSKAEMNDGYTETAAPDQLSEMMRIFEEEIATTQKPFLRVM